MNEVVDILKYVVPSLIVMLTAWVMIRYYFRSFMREQKRELLLQDRKKILPLSLQAYERLCLFLERMTVDSLVVREQDQKMTCREYHQHLLAMIRAEYEHNLTQQLYVSEDTWSLVKNAKEGTINLINSAAQQVNPEGPALELSKKILEVQIEVEVSPSQLALTQLKKEFRGTFGN